VIDGATDARLWSPLFPLDAERSRGADVSEGGTDGRVSPFSFPFLASRGDEVALEDPLLPSLFLFLPFV